MNDPLVSIIIPVYNAEKYLAETISSALNQTWLNKEVIVVDDGSTDQSFEIANTFANRVKIYRQDKLGASAARNKGLTEAKGDYIQFLDADDLLSPNKIKDQLSLISKKDGYLSISRTIYFPDGESPEDKYEHREHIEYYNEPVEFLLNMYNASASKNERGIVGIHSWLTPKNIIERAGRWNEKLSVDDDGEFFCRVMLASKGIVYVPDAVNYYRKFKTSVSLSSGRDIIAMKSLLLANELKYEHVKKETNNPLVNKAFARIFIENAVIFYPEFKSLYRIVINKVKVLGGIDYVPVLGGAGIELIKNIFGWRMAKLLMFYFRKINSK